MNSFIFGPCHDFRVRIWSPSLYPSWHQVYLLRFVDNRCLAQRGNGNVNQYGNTVRSGHQAHLQGRVLCECNPLLCSTGCPSTVHVGGTAGGTCRFDLLVRVSCHRLREMKPLRKGGIAGGPGRAELPIWVPLHGLGDTKSMSKAYDPFGGTRRPRLLVQVPRQGLWEKIRLLVRGPCHSLRETKKKIITKPLSR